MTAFPVSLGRLAERCMIQRPSQQHPLSPDPPVNSWTGFRPIKLTPVSLVSSVWHLHTIPAHHIQPWYGWVRYPPVRTSLKMSIDWLVRRLSGISPYYIQLVCRLSDQWVRWLGYQPSIFSFNVAWPISQISGWDIGLLYPILTVSGIISEKWMRYWSIINSWTVTWLVTKMAGWDITHRYPTHRYILYKRSWIYYYYCSSSSVRRPQIYTSDRMFVTPAET